MLGSRKAEVGSARPFIFHTNIFFITIFWPFTSISFLPFPDFQFPTPYSLLLQLPVIHHQAHSRPQTLDF